MSKGTMKFIVNDRGELFFEKAGSWQGRAMVAAFGLLAASISKDMKESGVSINNRKNALLAVINKVIDDEVKDVCIVHDNASL